MNALEFLKCGAFVAGVIALVIFGPFAWVWSINALFALHIPYSLETWLAAVFVNLQFSGVLKRLHR